MNSHLRKEQRVDKNGVTVTRLVRDETAKPAAKKRVLSKTPPTPTAVESADIGAATYQVLNEDYSFDRQSYALARRISIDIPGAEKPRVMRLIVNLDGAYAGQSRIRAELFDGDKFNDIVAISGTSENIQPLIASYVSKEDDKRESLEKVADIVLEQAVDILSVN